jgi:hypothetical protein
MTTAQFQTGTSLDDFKQFLKQTHLQDAESTFWSNRSMEGFSTGNVAGTVTTHGGETIGLSVDLLKESDTWKVQHVALNPNGVSAANGGSTVTAPDDTTLRALVNATMGSFAEAAKNRNYQTFYNSSSAQMKEKYTVAALTKAFAVFAGKDFTAVTQLELLFSPLPTVDSDGVLHVLGLYKNPTSGGIRFSFDYVQEAGSWKLLGIDVKGE